MEEFKYIFTLPQQKYTSITDWMDNINHLETWLNQHIGDHMELWAFSSNHNLQIAFKKPEHKTYFILAYDK
jgi:hypothetical protein